jgi:hypothetical protein
MSTMPYHASRAMHHAPQKSVLAISVIAVVLFAIPATRDSTAATDALTVGAAFFILTTMSLSLLHTVFDCAACSPTPTTEDIERDREKLQAYHRTINSEKLPFTRWVLAPYFLLTVALAGIAFGSVGDEQFGTLPYYAFAVVLPLASSLMAKMASTHEWHRRNGTCQWCQINKGNPGTGSI